MLSAKHYNAAVNASVVVRQDWMGVLTLTGADRVTWLQGMITNDVEKLAAGQGCYAAHLNAQGKLVAQMIVLVAEEEVLLLVERVAAAKLAAAFDRLIVMEDVQLRDISDEYEVLELIGPRARTTIEAWAGQSLPVTTPYAHGLLPDARILVSDLGYALIVARERAAEVLQGIATAGALETGRDTWDVLRTEAGLPVYGIDVDETTTLPELGQRGISYDKGCYIGQEVVARIKYIGHVNRRFVGFLCEGSDVPENRYAVQMQEKVVGYVTTGVFSPRMGKAIALGFVNRTAAEAGANVVLIGKGRNIVARVASLPFVPIHSGD
jgi:folate-binding protein YgfZ